MIFKRPSLDINWLPRSVRAGVSVPRIVYTGSERYGGAYWPRQLHRYVTPFDMDLREGAVIELGASTTPGTIAHEYRHHWQRECGAMGPPRATEWRVETTDYWADIRRYFLGNIHERDALMFETRYAPDDVNLAWLDAIHVSTMEMREWRPPTA